MTMPVEYQPGQAVRPPRVEFETRGEEDREASLKAGHVVFRDVDFAIVTPPGAYSVWEGNAQDWLKSQQREPYYQTLVRAYEAFKQGKEPPLEGTPIEMCTLYAPSEVKQIKLVTRTIEDMAAWPDGQLGMFGMHGVRYKQKAQHWLASANSVGAVAARVDALEAEKATQASENEQLRAQLAELQKKLEEKDGPRPKLGLNKGAAA